jgi:hypothetical protein
MVGTAANGLLTGVFSVRDSCIAPHEVCMPAKLDLTRLADVVLRVRAKLQDGGGKRLLPQQLLWRMMWAMPDPVWRVATLGGLDAQAHLHDGSMHKSRTHCTLSMAFRTTSLERIVTDRADSRVLFGGRMTIVSNAAAAGSCAEAAASFVFLLPPTYTTRARTAGLKHL